MAQRQANTTFEGSLILDDDKGDVYIVLDGHARHVPDVDTYRAIFSVPFQADKMKRVRRADIDTDELPLGRPIPKGRLLGILQVFLSALIACCGWCRSSPLYRREATRVSDGYQRSRCMD